MQSQNDTPRQLSAVRRVGIVAAISGVIVIAGFASEYALMANLVLGPAGYNTTVGVVVYVAAVVALAALHWFAAAEALARPEPRGFSVGLVVISSLGVLFFTGLAILGAQFFWAARPGVAPGEVVVFALLSLLCYAAPALASLVAAIVTARAGRDPINLRPVLVLAVVGASVLVLAVNFALSGDR